ncbi:MAG TPA: hypothetical protein VIC08_14370, partial [Cellvibrionaceae bacterium]
DRQAKPSRPNATVAPAAAVKNAKATTSAAISNKSKAARVYWHPVQNGHCLKINISGKPDIRCLGQWRRLLKDCQRLNSQRFEFDLKETGDFGLAALALLLMLKDSRQVKAPDFVLNQCNQELLRLLQWTGLNRSFTVRAVKARNA